MSRSTVAEGESNQSRKNGGKGREQSICRTLGPVSDLERHLPHDWWRTLFNSIYLKTDGDVVENDKNTHHEVDLLIRAAGLEPNDRILDLCCGQGRHCLELARRGFRNITGVDRSRYLVRLARKRAKNSGLSVSFHEGDARKFRLRANNFHCVAIMGNSFGYFDQEEEDLAVLAAVKRLLGSSGILVMDLVDGDWMKEHYVPRSWEWVDKDHFVCRERSLSSDERRLISREVVVHAERGVIVDQFYAERLYSQEQINDFLSRAGFISVRNHGKLQGGSTRNQDLGMMENRMLLTAHTPVAAPPSVKRSGPPFPNVTVLLGDPRLPDEVKPGGHFNEADIDTVDRMKQALGELREYEFEYVDNHAALLTQLRNKPPEFVLNLCDEGFNNDAFKELHIPAILEMLNIPYTGAGPASLGLCYNKSLVRAIADSLSVPTPLETYLDPDDQSATLPSVFPALVKPNFGDSSLGITMESVVETSEQLMSYLDKLRKELPGRPVLVQEFLSGAEYTVGIIGNPGRGYEMLPILAVDFSGLPGDLPQILGYESKWDADSAYWTDIKYVESDLDEDSKRLLYDYSGSLFERLDCRDYARFDFRAGSDGTIKLLEVNPNPGWCWDGKFNMMAGFAGFRYSDTLRMILRAAQMRVINGHAVHNGEVALERIVA